MELAENTVQALSRTAYQVIRREIIKCRLEPGLRVTRAQLIKKFEFGEAAIREALSRLDHENLVQVLPREGYVIAPITLKQVHDLFEMRLLIESSVARIAAGNIDPAELRRLDDVHRSHFGWTDREGLEEYVRSNTEFHVAVTRAAGNERLSSIMEDLLDEMERVMLLSYLIGRREQAVGDDTGHTRLTRALEDGDGNLAAEVMANQLKQNRRFVLESLLHAPGLQSVNVSGDFVEMPNFKRNRDELLSVNSDF